MADERVFEIPWHFLEGQPKDHQKFGGMSDLWERRVKLADGGFGCLLNCSGLVEGQID